MDCLRSEETPGFIINRKTVCCWVAKQGTGCKVQGAVAGKVGKRSGSPIVIHVFYITIDFSTQDGVLIR